MVGRNGLEEADRYGLVGWVAGILLSAAITAVMFIMADGYF
jgi:hypothetical protein